MIAAREPLATAARPPPSPQVMLIQHGARRNYITARQLEAAGLLSSLVCDAAWTGDRPPLALRLAVRIAPRLAGALQRRHAPVSSDRLRAHLAPNLFGWLKHVMHDEQAFHWFDEVQALATTLGGGLRGANAVISYHGNGGSFLHAAKASGARVAIDFVITPKYLEIEDQERARWPGWERGRISPAVMAAYRRRMSRLVSLADLYLCPSESVARDLGDLSGFDPAKVRLTPYGLSGVLTEPAQPKLGRVLFAGAAGLRKGLPYLAQAADLLKARGSQAEIVVAGHVSQTVRALPETRNLKFLGVLDRAQMAHAFAEADVFCLPSLAEGSATVVFEAMANGLPIVTTASSGTVVKHGREGFIVAERNGKEIADAIDRIVSDRATRAAFSANSTATAAIYGDDGCGETFLAVVRELLSLTPAESSDRKGTFLAG